MLVLFATLSLAIAAFALLEFRMVASFWRTRIKDRAAPVGKSTPANNRIDSPLVCVQLPVFNEPNVSQSLITAVNQLEYPRDRLTVQILDDSTDQTPALIETLLDEIDPQRELFEHQRRESREGYKAGALKYGMEQSNAEFFAIFDADFLPPPDFLRRALIESSWFDDPGIAFVQGRWSFYNSEENLLTRVQSILIDRHFHLQKPFQVEGHRTVHFNGSGGVWRRAAIEAAGGWTADTLCEDLDLTYRCALSGYSGGYDIDLVCPSEIPSDIAAFKLQQRRWAKGSAQCATKLLPSVLRSDRMTSRIDDVHVLLGYMIHPLLLSYTLVWPWVVLSGASFSFLMICQLALVIGNIAAISGFFSTYRLRDDAATPVLKGLWEVLISIGLGVGLMVNNSMAFLTGVVSHHGVFDRTPKSGGAPHSPASGPKLHWTVYAEAVVSAYGLGSGLYLFSKGYFIWGQQSLFLGLVLLGLTLAQLGAVVGNRRVPAPATAE